jgi:hypothetical protein
MARRSSAESWVTVTSFSSTAPYRSSKRRRKQAHRAPAERTSPRRESRVVAEPDATAPAVALVLARGASVETTAGQLGTSVNTVSTLSDGSFRRPAELG